uniref:Succinate dehydogenase/fumarate reductase N-terminal domain-containing protein n=1 Tax=candidate division WOR-3 bacterium TaxID=2052148 RepID=A0A7C2P0V3_UNCW3
MSERKVTIKIFRFNPDIDYARRYENYELPWREGLLLIQALQYIRDNLDNSFAFRDYCCGYAWCMSCLMMVNGKGSQACLKF